MQVHRTVQGEAAMLPNTNANRRELMRTLLAAGIGASGTAAFAGEPGKLTNAEFKTLAVSPKTMADHREGAD